MWSCGHHLPIPSLILNIKSVSNETIYAVEHRKRLQNRIPRGRYVLKALFKSKNGLFIAEKSTKTKTKNPYNGGRLLVA